MIKPGSNINSSFYRLCISNVKLMISLCNTYGSPAKIQIKKISNDSKYNIHSAASKIIIIEGGHPMADVKMNPVFEGFSKQIGDLVFVHSNGKTFVRRKGNPGNPKTLKQMGVRNALSELVQDWSEIGGILHVGWKLSAKKKKMKGNNAFVSENFQNQREGLPVQLFKTTGNLKLAEFTAAAGASGEIACTYTIDGDAAGKHISFFVKKQTMGMATGKVIMYNGGVDQPSPFTISGLEHGASYYIYAVVTDAEYSSATEVSASIGVIAAAGI